ncbi:MAG: hypothetical protein ACYTDW_02910, partial [Planctomycetota bacterium]
KMSPQMLTLHKSSPDIYHFLAKYYNFQKNIGPAEDSMSVFIDVQLTSISYGSFALSSKATKISSGE